MAKKGWSPPKNTTILISLIILLGGAGLGIGAWNNEWPADLIPINWNTNEILMYGSIIFPLLAYLVFYIGVRSRNL